MELAKIEVDTFGGSPVATHNMPCAVCREKHAVLDLSCGVMKPCWGCQKDGWRTDYYRPDSFLHRFMKWAMNEQN